MKKINNEGFVLAETLIVTVFLMTIFTMVFSQFYPLIGEYEKRENYDDIDSVYSSFWLKRMMEDSSFKITGDAATNFNNNKYVEFSCSFFDDAKKQKMCESLYSFFEIEHAYITTYKIGCESGNCFKNIVASSTGFSSGFKDYVFSLPDYNYESLSYARYRVIVSFYHKPNPAKPELNYYSYGTVEVNR